MQETCRTRVTVNQSSRNSVTHSQSTLMSKSIYVTLKYLKPMTTTTLIDFSAWCGRQQSIRNKLINSRHSSWTVNLFSVNRKAKKKRKNWNQFHWLRSPFSSSITIHLCNIVAWLANRNRRTSASRQLPWWFFTRHCVCVFVQWTLDTLEQLNKWARSERYIHFVHIIQISVWPCDA